MTETKPLSHCVTALVAVPARQAFDFLADPAKVGNWSLGCMQTQATDEPGLYSGRSLFNGEQSWFAVEPREALLLVDYHTGMPGALVSRISARIIAAETCNLPPSHCYVTLTAWRPSDMTDERWQLLCAAHEAEIWLIKSQLERAAQQTTTGRTQP